MKPFLLKTNILRFFLSHTFYWQPYILFYPILIDRDRRSHTKSQNIIVDFAVLYLHAFLQVYYIYIVIDSGY